MEGRPPPDAPEVAADEAAGAPLERPAEVEAGQPDETQGRRKRHRPTQDEARGKKREAEDIEDLYLNEGPAPGSIDDPEVVVQHQKGGSSGSGQQPESVPDVAMPEEGQAEPEEPTEEAMIGLVERIFQKEGIKCTNREARTISNLVGSLGADFKSDVPVNDGLCLNVEEKELKLHTEAGVEELSRRLREDKPLLLIGLPPDGPFADLQRKYEELEKIPKEKVKKRLEKGRKELRSCLDGHKHQVHEGRYYLQECPRGMKSWEHAQYQSLSEESYTVEGPMCVWSVDESGKALAGSKLKKKTRWITNSAAIASALKRCCKESSPHVLVWKRRLVFEEGKIKVKLRYPPKLVNAIVKGIKAQLVLDGEMREIGHVGGPDPHEEADFEEHHHSCLPKANELHVSEPVIDANTGATLDPKKVAEARASELEWVKRQGVYTKISEDTCYAETGRPPITLKWVDRNKGDSVHENYRSRLVVREVKSKGDAAMLPEYSLFSSMPPLEALKLMCSLLATLRVSRGGGKLTLKLTDISRAHFYGTATRRIFVNLPEGDETPGMCGLLLKTMYGTRDASSTWQKDYTSLLQKHGFKSGQAWPCIFLHEERSIRLLVHGDDFLVLADEEGHAFVDRVLRERYEFKCDGHIGPGQSKQNMSVLNRMVTYHPDSGLVTYEADPRHWEAIVRELGLEKAKPAKTPAEKKKHGEVMKSLELPPLNDGLQRQYRSLTMRAAFLAQDRPDLAEATKSLARHMKTPNESAYNDLKRLGRYLRGRQRLVFEYWPQRYQKEITVFCDSDHAGCIISRRSTTGLVTMFGSHCIKHSSNIQSTVSLSSGESEYYAIVRAASTGLSIQALLSDWGLQVSLAVKSDSSAARGMTQRQGLGQTRHVETRYLWVQEKVQRKALTLEKVNTSQNVSDICAKPLPEVAVNKHLRTMGLKFTEGRAQGAKQLV